MEQKQILRADEFTVGSFISVNGVVGMSHMRLDAITNSAVHVYNNGSHTTISCGSPCYQSTDDEKSTVHVPESFGDDVETEEKPKVVKEKPGKAGRPQGIQGKIIADKLAEFVFPTEPFTVKKVVELTGIDQLHLISFIKNNCQEVGEEEKVPGKRGRAAKLYLKK